MSENYRYYAMKMAERRIKLADSGAHRAQLIELLETVARCEAMWALEIRIENRR